MAGILDYFEFFQRLPKDQQMMIGEDKGISGLGKKIFYPDSPDGTPYLPQTRLGKFGMNFDKGVSSKLDQALEFPAQLGKELYYGGSNVYNYLMDKPQSTVDKLKQKQLKDKYSDFSSLSDTIQAQLNSIGVKPTVTGPESDPQPVQDDKNQTDTSTSTDTSTDTELEMADDETFGLTEVAKESIAPEDEGLPSDDTEQPSGEEEKKGKSYLEQLTEDTAKSYVDALKGEEYKVGTIGDYKKEFAKATGIDISGKPDMRTTMTALGLALMQNKAGKGFNVGKLLGAVGEAGEKALPLADAARKEAKAGQLAAGKYALAEKAKDTKAREALAREGRNALNAINTQDLDFKQKMAIEAQKHQYQLDIEKLKVEGDYEKELLKQGDSGKADLQRIKNISTIKGEQFFDVQMGYDKTSQAMKYALPQDINKIGNGYEKIIRAQNSISDMTDLLTQIQNAPEGPLATRLLDRAKNIGVGIGLLNPKKVFGDAVITVDGQLQVKEGISREGLLKAMQDSLIAEYKGFLTQEKGNGISNDDVKRLKELIGELNFFGNPEEAKFRLKEVSEIFGNVESQFETILTDMGNKDMWANEESFLQAQRNLNSIFNKGAGSDIYGLSSELADDGLAVYKIS